MHVRKAAVHSDMYFSPNKPGEVAGAASKNGLIGLEKWLRKSFFIAELIYTRNVTLFGPYGMFRVPLTFLAQT